MKILTCTIPKFIFNLLLSLDIECWVPVSNSKDKPPSIYWTHKSNIITITQNWCPTLTYVFFQMCWTARQFKQRWVPNEEEWSRVKWRRHQLCRGRLWLTSCVGGGNLVWWVDTAKATHKSNWHWNYCTCEVELSKWIVCLKICSK